MPDPTMIPLPALPRALAEYTGGPTKPYSTIYRAVLDARIPVTQADNGRYQVDRHRLPEIARALGLPVPTAGKQRTAA